MQESLLVADTITDKTNKDGLLVLGKITDKTMQKNLLVADTIIDKTILKFPEFFYNIWKGLNLGKPEVCPAMAPLSEYQLTHAIRSDDIQAWRAK